MAFSRFVFATTIILLTLPIAAAAEEPSVDSACKKAERLSPYVDHLPNSREFNSLFGCESYRLYYGIGVPADPIRARKCAFIEVVDNERVFGGSTILMTIYANGNGAPRNFDFAIKYACMSFHAPAERAAAVRQLLKYREQHWEGSGFHACDYVTSGFMAGHCSSLQREIASQPRRKALDAMISTWPAVRRDAWQKLAPIVQEFIDTHVENEVDLSGTARVALQIEEQERLEQATYDFLLQLHQGETKFTGPDQAQEADARLDTIYKAVQQLPDHQVSGTITRDGISETQQAWLRYRDAWLQFIGTAFPHIDSGHIRARLTLERIDKLKQYLQ